MVAHEDQSWFKSKLESELRNKTESHFQQNPNVKKSKFSVYGDPSGPLSI